MSVYDEILEWSQSRPSWQRDALRRLLHQAELTHADIVELADICESEFGVRALEVPFVPLTHSDLPSIHGPGGATHLHALRDLENVDALAGELEFEPRGLSLIFGPNGSGKSGYARLLKQMCRARGAAQPVRANVFKPDADAPSATLVYSVAGSEYQFAWRADATAPEPLAAVSVFDAFAAEVYVGDKTDVAYRPAGLDLLPRLAGVCDSLYEELSRRQGAGSGAPLPHVKARTRAAEFLAGLNAKTKPVDVEAACTFSAQGRKDEVARKLTELEAPERKAQAATLKGRIERFQTAATKLEQITESLSEEAMQRHRDAKVRAEAFGSAAVAAAQEAFSTHPVQPVGSRLWRALLESAQAYFDTDVNPTVEFPGDHCVLCQQELSQPARQRLSDFAVFVSQHTETAAKEADRLLRERTDKLEKLHLQTDLLEAVVVELTESSPALADRIRRFLAAAEQRRAMMLNAMAGGDWDGVPASQPCPAGGVRTLVQEMEHELLALRQAPDDDAIQALRSELDELRASETLSEQADTIKAFHRSAQKAAQYAKCLKSAKTTAVSRKNGELIRGAVTAALESSFAEEFGKLGSAVLPVALEEGGTRKGEKLHRLQVAGAAPKTSPSGIASAGEGRLIALAGFFTELVTAPAKSAIVFDDPSAYLDLENASRVAHRIAEAATEHQVIVFTHDAAFAELLMTACAQTGAPRQRLALRRDGVRTGLCSA